MYSLLQSVAPEAFACTRKRPAAKASWSSLVDSTYGVTNCPTFARKS